MSALADRPERVVRCEDATSGLRGVIVVDDTTLGPALGGIRLRPYPTLDAAEEECRRLARGMTRKNALAEIGFGGGKSVIVADGPIADRGALLRAFGRFVAALDGAYVPAVDMGTSVADLQVVAEVAPDVSCDDADPSPATARGVFAAIERAVEHALGGPLDAVRVVVQGVGHVGADLARRLADAGAEVLVADLDGGRAELLAAEIGGTAIAADDAVATACDVLVPCATARVVDAHTIDRLACRVIAGAANDVLAEPALAEALRAREIAYVPDFVASAGGVIHVRALRDGWSPARLEAALVRIGERAERVLVEAAASGRTTVAVAEAMVDDRLAAAA
ncbi:Leucine dehydrogenase [Baekduia alba]|uniref:Glu/Leu/Phe/Val dehydrogenase dimerization domain-containing protein n=1 Tax=Baekduia alba TaxID=2997333 RepID=UPI002341289F|nr:Glu/Leu/Phe/Val dehydrogenase dimerization domain-containing protein [Baekduia alba]WCB96868.1 Leucine dehydrogenase [Baekduia alba]